MFLFDHEKTVNESSSVNNLKTASAELLSKKNKLPVEEKSKKRGFLPLILCVEVYYYFVILE